MTAVAYELLVTADDVVSYLASRGILPRLADRVDAVEVREVTAGNMNRVFLARGPLGSVAVKQAPPFVQVAPDWPVDPVRIASEARAYELLAGLVPESIPTIEAVDLERFVLVMEDLSDLRVLRDVLVEQVEQLVSTRPAEPGSSTADSLDFAELGRVVGRFSAELTVATSRVTLDADAHAALIDQAANPELCAMTEAVVLDEPYREHEHNHWLPELDDAVRAMRADPAVIDGVTRVREAFETRAEALIHGDLHTGSVMAGTRDGSQAVKVFDPEFGFVGPVGMDLGLFWANLVLASIAARAAGAATLADDRLLAVTESWAEFGRVLREKTGGAGVDGLTTEEWLARIEADAWGFAGVESIRRVAGFSHAADLTTLPPDASVAAHAELLSRAIGWVTTQRDPLTASTAHPTPPGDPVTLALIARTVVLDLEGTTSAAGFILGDLYDYARPRLLPYLRDHADDALVIEARQQVIRDAGLPADASDADIVAQLHEWMASDVKSTPLKTLQGQIWAEGFARDEISSHFFDDVIPKLRAWSAAGVRIAVFSSGSVASQVPWFRHSPGGDLTPLIVDYFDTVNAGPKKVSASYDVIAQALGDDPHELVFFTDHPEEVAAARAASWQVIAFSREGEPWFGADFGDAPVVSSFDELEVTAP